MKNPPGKKITDLICLPLLKYRRRPIKSPRYRIATRKVSPTDNLPVKIRPARVAGKLPAKGKFLRGEAIL